ncbi:MAG: hypothetical protein H9L35_06730 [Acinetobacter sp.]|uniref:hypothetical protein n=1 Tax=Acinetobacter TaxID=469 RepID=UPI0019BBE5CB|nr:hypothetical protein [Acinetobacter sp.]MBC6675918.1 hypothetical protein [Acinetobacter sp.]
MDKKVIEAIDVFLTTEINMLESVGEFETSKHLKSYLNTINHPDNMIEEGKRQNLTAEYMERLALKSLKRVLLDYQYPDTLPIYELLDAEIEKYTNQLG